MYFSEFDFHSANFATLIKAQPPDVGIWAETGDSLIREHTLKDIRVFKVLKD